MPDEMRAYTPEQLAVLGERGQAFEANDGSYSTPVADAVDLREAIRTVGRGDHVDERKFVIKRANALEVGDLIPGNWRKDGTLEAPREERETYGDIYTALSTALQEQIAPFTDGYWYCWLQDFDDENLYFQAGGALYSSAYELDPSGPVTLGDPVRVRPVTSYIETETERAERAQRAGGDCSLCGGTGNIRDGSVECPDCGGTGNEENAQAPDSLPAGTAAIRRLAAATIEYRKTRIPKAGDIERLSLERVAEQRNLPVRRVELREADDDSGMLTFTGYASVTNTPYEVGFYSETIARGAFKRALSNPSLDVVLLFNHEGPPLARTVSGTMRLTEDARGLFVEADLDPEDEDVKRLAPKILRGDLTEMSFAFRANQQEWSEDYSRRTITEAEIQRGDVSIVTYGASPSTSLALRSEDALRSVRAIGAPALIEALREYAFDLAFRARESLGAERFAAMLDECRAGAKFSSASLEKLTQVLGLIATADDAVDEAQPLLADLMGVPNPDDDGEADDDAERSAPAAGDGVPEVRSAGTTAPEAPEGDPTPAPGGSRAQTPPDAAAMVDRTESARALAAINEARRAQRRNA